MKLAVSYAGAGLHENLHNTSVTLCNPKLNHAQFFIIGAIIITITKFFKKQN